MEGEAKGQVGGVDTSRAVRERLAGESRAWRCVGCRRSCEEIMREKEEEVAKDGEGDRRRKEDVPAELRLGYRDELGAKEKTQVQNTPDAAGVTASTEKPSASREPSAQTRSVPESSHNVNPGAGSIAHTVPITAPTTGMPVLPARTASQQAPQRPRQQEEGSSWLDLAIVGLMAALIYMIIRKLASWL